MAQDSNCLVSGAGEGRGDTEGIRRDRKRLTRRKGVYFFRLMCSTGWGSGGRLRKAWGTACVAAGLGRSVCERCNRSVKGHTCEERLSEARYTGRIFHDFAGLLFATWFGRASLSVSISGHRPGSHRPYLSCFRRVTPVKRAAAH